MKRRDFLKTTVVVSTGFAATSNTVLVEEGNPSKTEESKKDWRSKTSDDLYDEMARWVGGIKDGHDHVIDAAKQKLREKHACGQHFCCEDPKDEEHHQEDLLKAAQKAKAKGMPEIAEGLYDVMAARARRFELIEGDPRPYSHRYVVSRESPGCLYLDAQGMICVYA